MIDYDLLGTLIGLPPDARILQVGGDNRASNAELIVEGCGPIGRYSWEPGYSIMCRRVASADDLRDATTGE